MFESLQPPWTVVARLLCPWNFPGENTGMGCYSRGSSQTRDQTHVSVSPALASGFFTPSTTWEAYVGSVQFSHSVVSDSLWPHESQHARPPCPSPTPGVYSDSRASSQWCHPAISSSVIPFSSCPQSLPASESFPMSQLYP